MKWHEAYRCKICGKIYKSKCVLYCKRCGAELSRKEGMSDCDRLFARPNQPYYPQYKATENLEPITARRVLFGYETRPSNMPEWIIRGEAPPRKIQVNKRI